MPCVAKILFNVSVAEDISRSWSQNKKLFSSSLHVHCFKELNTFDGICEIYACAITEALLLTGDRFEQKTHTCH